MDPVNLNKQAMQTGDMGIIDTRSSVPLEQRGSRGWN